MKQFIPKTPGAYVAFYLEDGKCSAATAQEWPILEEMGYVAEGVLAYLYPNLYRVMGLDQNRIKIISSSTNMDYTGGGYSDDSDINKEFFNFDGFERTATIVKSQGSNAPAPYWCYNYESENIKKNKWWLPTIGELFPFFYLQQQVQECLEVITGATLLYREGNIVGGVPTSYWSISEKKNSHLFTCIHFAGLYGIPYQLAGASVCNVRPVTSFEDL